jgi:hypothetical protein
MLAVVLIFALGCRSQAANIVPPESVFVPDGSLSATNGITAKRASHTSTLLGNGKVLIAGGFVGDGGGLASAELYDPATGKFTSIGDMATGRSSHTATLLPNGKVLIAGGYNGSYLNSSELYDPATNKFTPGGRMVMARSGHIAVPLNEGRVLLAGGVGTGWTFLADAEIYDPQNGTFSATGSMTTARESHIGTLLNDGRVLIVGGHKGRRADVTIYRSTEIFDPASGKFTPAGDMAVKRHKHDATRLADGRVLIVGGSDERDGGGAYIHAEIYDPTRKTFTRVKNELNMARYTLQGTSILLKNGKVLIAGGADRAEVFDPATDTFSFAKGDMGTTRLFASATLLDSGKVLITGGYTDGVVVSSAAWIYDS